MTTRYATYSFFCCKVASAGGHLGQVASSVSGRQAGVTYASCRYSLLFPNPNSRSRHVGSSSKFFNSPAETSARESRLDRVAPLVRRWCPLCLFDYVFREVNSSASSGQVRQSLPVDCFLFLDYLKGGATRESPAH